MEKSVVEKISGIVFMPGVDSVNILPSADQVWVSVVGRKETRAVVDALANVFSSEAYDASCDNRASYVIYPSGLIISVSETKEKLSAPTESNKENTHLDSTIDLSRVESLLAPWENEVSFESLRKEVKACL